MHDLSGLLLQYYMLNKRLPATLEEVRPLAKGGESTDFNCPGDSRPFVYLPQSPQALAADRVVVYAPGPAADGKYRAIIMGFPRNLAPAASVVNLSQPELQGQLALTPGAANAPTLPNR
jgi:hypothetical protein